jgi:uncharacterized protein YgiM (DUF1202 family)
MKKKHLAEAIYLFSRIETLLREHGGTGESFSDLVKSFNKKIHREEKLKAKKQKADKIGYKFYYADGEYHIKDQYEYEYDIDEELFEYEESKRQWREYIEYKRGLIGGFYNNLRTIGHERNQLMHQADYHIPNFSRFKKACYQVIDYLEDGAKPLFPVSLHENESLRKKVTHIAVDEPLFWFRYLLTLPVVYWLFHRFGICASCSDMAFYGVLAGVSLFFFHLFYIALGVLAFTFKSEDNMKGVFFLVILGIVVYSNFTDKEGRSSKRKKSDDTTASYRSGGECTYYYVKSSSLNIRAGTSVRSPKVGGLRHNEQVCVIRTKGDWAYVNHKGWVAEKYLSSTKVPALHTKKQKHTSKVDESRSDSQIRVKQKIEKKKPKKKVEVWHCEARAKRASGWVEKVGKENAVKGALHQCEIRRVTEIPCRITRCYQVR